MPKTSVIPRKDNLFHVGLGLLVLSLQQVGDVGRAGDHLEAEALVGLRYPHRRQPEVDRALRLRVALSVALTIRANNSVSSPGSQ